ncbi:hypothetical protein C1646_759842 [Rhizophagus diaphanus]|nr:hypothetical protein C1646_759842 [Rhizophagus diaphanus] [Rhizophagus sp. MUCL 43196]
MIYLYNEYQYIITYTIKYQVYFELNIIKNADIKAAIKDICEISIAYLKIETKLNKRNSNLFEWTWLSEGSMADYILGQEISNIGD